MRKKYRLTQQDLSEKAGVGLRFVRELEQGKLTLRLDKVNQIFELFGSECGPVPDQARSPRRKPLTQNGYATSRHLLEKSPSRRPHRE